MNNKDYAKELEDLGKEYATLAVFAKDQLANYQNYIKGLDKRFGEISEALLNGDCTPELKSAFSELFNSKENRLTKILLEIFKDNSI